MYSVGVQSMTTNLLDMQNYDSYIVHIPFVYFFFTSLQQRGHLETASPFTVPCEGREAR